MPWGARGGLFRPVTEDDYAKDPDHLPLTHRLNTLREVREKIVVVLTEMLELRETYTSNRENCNDVQTELLDLLKQDNQDVTKLVEGSASDHSMCSDCAFVHSITLDCRTTYAELHTLQMEATRQLEALVDVRERIYECMEAIDDGNTAGSSSFTGGRRSSFAAKQQQQTHQQQVAAAASSTSPTHSAVDRRGSDSSTTDLADVSLGT